jgi:hypothetical protein
VRKGLKGRGRKTALQFCFWSFAQRANSMLVSSVEFCRRQNSRSKSIMGPGMDPQSGATFHLCKASLHSACRSGFMTGTPGKPEFFAVQKMRPNEAVNKSPVSVNNL